MQRLWSRLGGCSMKYKLGDLLTIKHGYPFKGEFFSDKGEKIILTPANFYEKGGFKYTPGKEKYYISEFPEEYLCKKGDLIVAMTQQAEGLLGSTAFVPEDNTFLHNQRIGLITTFEDLLIPEYADYLMRTKSVRKQIRGSASGTKVKHTSPEKIYDVEVDIPDVKIQRKIAEVLRSIEGKINNNISIIQDYSAISSMLYDYWFLQYDFPNEQGKPYKTSGGAMQWNEELKQDIPLGWKVLHVSDFAEVVTGKEDANHSVLDGEFPFFTCSNEVLRCSDYKFDGKAVLIAGNGDFNVKYYEGKFNAYQRTYVLMPHDELYTGVIYHSTLRTINRFKNSSNGSIVKFITKGDVEDIIVLVPEDKTLIKIFNNLLDAVEAIRNENSDLEDLEDFIHPIIMNGQVGFKEL